MSAAQHDASAQHEERVARDHQALDAIDSQPATGACDAPNFDVCWTPTKSHQHAKLAEQHRALAARHRAANAALRAAEARACSGIGDADRITSPFSHSGDLDHTATKKLERSVPNREDGSDYMVKSGARVVLRAVPGMTAEWLQRLAECHLARNAAIGHAEASQQMPSCPLTLAGVRAQVMSVGNGFAVDITSDDEGVAAEILRRALALGNDPR